MRNCLSRRDTVIALSAWLAIGLCGCGQSGSDPLQFPEVRFEVRPSGPATFRVDSLVGGGATHSSVLGQQFSATSAFAFTLENAGGPFEARVTRLSGGEITVTLTVVAVTGQVQVTDSTGPGKETAVVMATGPAPVVTPGAFHREVRLDVCAPTTGATSCGAVDDPGIFGVAFTGTLGDLFTSHPLSGVAPSIYFLEGARDSVNAVFTRQAITGDLLQVQLYIDGQLRQTRAATRDVVIREDL